MRWESLVLAFVTQAIQAGIKEHWALSYQPSHRLVGDVIAETQCHCVCQCSLVDPKWLGVGFGGVVGPRGLLSCWCSCRREPPLSPVGYRRRGYGVVTEPGAWDGVTAFRFHLFFYFFVFVECQLER